jgi:hypothetical protein
MELGIVDQALVVFEDAAPAAERVARDDNGSLVLVDSGESVVRVPLLSGSLPARPGTVLTLARATTDARSTSYEFKLFGAGAKRSARVTISRSTELSIASGETRARWLLVPIA